MKGIALAAAAAVLAVSPGYAGTKLIAGYISEEPGLQRTIEKAGFSISCDRESATYRCGETATFSILPVFPDGTVITGVTVKARLDNFGDFIVAPESRFEMASTNAIVLKGTLLKPGFLRVRASMALVAGDGNKKKDVSRSWAVAYEPQKIRPGTPDVRDFDAFWSNAVAKLERETPLDMKCRKVEELSQGDKDFYVFDFNTACGRRLNGSMTVPKKLKAPYPVRVRLPGAGCGAGANRITTLMPFDDALCMMVYPFDWPQAITGALDEVQAKYDGFWEDCVKKYGVPWYCAGISVSREEFFYYSVILGANRAVEWLRSPESGFPVDKENFVYAGASQGGGLGLALVYLNGHFRKAFFGVTGISDMLGFNHQARQCGWPAIVMAHDPEHRAAVASRIRYFDGVNFARRLKLPVWFTAGYGDTACPPAAVWATYNACASKDKHISGMIGVGHSISPEAQKEVEEWIKK